VVGIWPGFGGDLIGLFETQNSKFFKISFQNWNPLEIIFKSWPNHALKIPRNDAFPVLPSDIHPFSFMMGPLV
jgi:hypothetical protein